MASPELPAPAFMAWAADRKPGRTRGKTLPRAARAELAALGDLLAELDDAPRDLWVVKWVQTLGRNAQGPMHAVGLRTKVRGDRLSASWTIALVTPGPDALLALAHERLDRPHFVDPVSGRDLDGDGAHDLALVTDLRVGPARNDMIALLVTTTPPSAHIVTWRHRLYDPSGVLDDPRDHAEELIHACTTHVGDQLVWIAVHKDTDFDLPYGLKARTLGYGLDVHRLGPDGWTAATLWGVAVGDHQRYRSKTYALWRELAGRKKGAPLVGKAGDFDLERCPGDPPTLVLPAERLTESPDSDASPVAKRGFHVVTGLATDRATAEAAAQALSTADPTRPARVVRLAPGTHFAP